MAEAVQSLNGLLRGEISAVETYVQALDRVKDPEFTSVLQQCKREHEERAVLLSNLVTKAGGTPETKSGPWGFFAKLVEAGATALGPEPAIGALEEGEDHGIESYKAELKKLESPYKEVVEQQLYPSQVATQQAITDLKKNYSQIKR
ncbi:unnamed protein product [Sphagnum jensenii]|jgi:uncharacterized protein (TIGR02284 family)